MPEREPVAEAFTRVPHELRAHSQWVNWLPDDESKVPINPKTFGNAGVTWQNTWGDFHQAKMNAARHDLGMGFVLTEADSYTCIDLDKCVLSDGQIDARTREILDMLAGWVELSPSGTGLHVWVKNEMPVNRRTRGIEVYSSQRWMTVTGRSNPMGPGEIPERTEAVAMLLDLHFPNRPNTHIETPTANIKDTHVWEQLFSSSRGAFFRSLYNGDVSVCYGDHSRAVIMLANQLAIMTNFDAGRMQQLLYETGLVRGKWEETRGAVTWIEYQIQDAITYMSGSARKSEDVD